MISFKGLKCNKYNNIKIALKYFKIIYMIGQSSFNRDIDPNVYTQTIKMNKLWMIYECRNRNIPKDR